MTSLITVSKKHACNATFINVKSKVVISQVISQVQIKFSINFSLKIQIQNPNLKQSSFCLPITLITGSISFDQKAFGQNQFRQHT